MDLGSALQLFGLDLGLLQGIVNFLHETLPAFRTIEDEDGAYRLALDPPQVEIRDDESGYRMGIHLVGQLFLGEEINPFVFDAWVRLRPEVGSDASGNPVGVLLFDAVEEVTPPIAEPLVAAAFGPDGVVGAALDTLQLDVFTALIASVNDQLFPNNPTVDVDDFSLAFYLGRPAALDRPVYDLGREGEDWIPLLQFEYTDATVPALVASVALAGETAVPPESPSIIRHGTGLGLITTDRLFESRFALESAALIGTEMQGLTIDRFTAETTDYGFLIDGAGHKTGADVTFSGSLMAHFEGGIGGQLTMRNNIETDVDTAWWVDLLGVVAAIVPVVGWILGDIFIWGPAAEAPEQVENALLDRFLTPLDSAAQSLASQFNISIIPTSAFLSDVWFFDGNMGVAAAAFAGRQTAGVQSVSRDIAYLAMDPAGAGRPSNRRRPVESVYEITLDDGRRLKPWQAGQLVEDGLLDIPGHHAVRNDLARNGIYLRSNPDELRSNNLLS